MYLNYSNKINLDRDGKGQTGQLIETPVIQLEHKHYHAYR